LFDPSNGKVTRKLGNQLQLQRSLGNIWPTNYWEEMCHIYMMDLPMSNEGIKRRHFSYRNCTSTGLKLPEIKSIIMILDGAIYVPVLKELKGLKKRRKILKQRCLTSF